MLIRAANKLDPEPTAKLSIMKQQKREIFVDFIQHRADSSDLLSYFYCYRIFRRGGGSFVAGTTF
jgi:hypothetical protein